MELTSRAYELVTGSNFAVATSNPDRSIEQSVVCARERDRRVIFSIVEGRAKHRNPMRDPQIGRRVLGDANAHRYCEIHGGAEIEGGASGGVIAELSLKYTREQRVNASGQRVIVAVTPDPITEHG